jgi:hypothetical protein
MSTAETSRRVFIKLCDLCDEPIDKYADIQGSFQHIKKIKEERPLKTKWYHVLLYAFDGKPTYDVHHSCLYDLVRERVERVATKDEETV